MGCQYVTEVEPGIATHRCGAKVVQHVAGFRQVVGEDETPMCAEHAREAHQGGCDVEHCDRCGGTGEVSVTLASWDCGADSETEWADCPSCDGTGGFGDGD